MTSPINVVLNCKNIKLKIKLPDGNIDLEPIINEIISVSNVSKMEAVTYCTYVFHNKKDNYLIVTIEYNQNNISIRSKTLHDKYIFLERKYSCSIEELSNPTMIEIKNLYLECTKNNYSLIHPK